MSLPDKLYGIKVEFWKCCVCHKLTDKLEAELRNFNTDKCACGGMLKPWPPIKVELPPKKGE